MPVILQGDLILNDFWKNVKGLLIEMLCDENRFDSSISLSEWTIILRPKTQADEDFTKDPDVFELTPQSAKRLEKATWSEEIDTKAKRYEVSLPWSFDRWIDPDNDHGPILTPSQMAQELIDNLELQANL